MRIRPKGPKPRLMQLYAFPSTMIDWFFLFTVQQKFQFTNAPHFRYVPPISALWFFLSLFLYKAYWFFWSFWINHIIFTFGKQLKYLGGHDPPKKGKKNHPMKCYLWKFALRKARLDHISNPWYSPTYDFYVVTLLLHALLDKSIPIKLNPSNFYSIYRKYY